LCSSRKYPYPPHRLPWKVIRNSWEEGILKAKILEAKNKAHLEFLGGREYKTKNLLWGEYGYFLELHISFSL